MGYIIQNVSETDHCILRHLASECGSLDVHTHYTYWVMCKYFGSNSFILYEGMEPIGYIMALETADTVFIWQVGILPEYRHLKLSHELYDAVFKVAKNKGKDVELSIAPDNRASYGAFESYCNGCDISFEKIGSATVKDINGTLIEDEVLYHARLNE